MASRLHYKKSELVHTAFQRSSYGKPSCFRPLFITAKEFNNHFDLACQHLLSFGHFFLAFSQSHAKKNRRRFYVYNRLFFERYLYFTFLQQLTADAKKLFFVKGYFIGFFSELAFNRMMSYHSTKTTTPTTASEAFRGVTPAALYHLTGGVLLSFLNFSAQASIPPRSLDSIFAIKRRNFRLAKAPALGLQGFRIRLHGRFTRKQIAASYHFQEGSMPLSSMKAFIDYGFTTVPLRNSAIGVKV